MLAISERPLSGCRFNRSAQHLHLIVLLVLGSPASFAAAHSADVLPHSALPASVPTGQPTYSRYNFGTVANVKITGRHLKQEVWAVIFYVALFTL